VLPSGKKLTLSLLATITLDVVPFRAYSPFLAHLPFLKCILEVLFCESVQHRLRFCLDHFSYVKIAAFQFCLPSEKNEYVRRVGDVSHVVLVKNSPVKKEV
jgi:hypothetical protein